MNTRARDYASVRSQLVNYLVRFTSNSGFASVTDTTTLGECGLDSFGMFDFVVGIEQEFGISIDDHSFDVRNFRTIGSVVDFLVARVGD